MRNAHICRGPTQPVRITVAAANLSHVSAAEREEPVQRLGVESCRDPGQLLALGVGSDKNRNGTLRTLRRLPRVYFPNRSRWFLSH